MQNELQPLFPSLGLWKCKGHGIFAAPDNMKSTALYVTATSTSTESAEAARTSVQSLRQAATTLPVLRVSSPSGGLLLAPLATVDVTAGDVQVVDSTSAHKPSNARLPDTTATAALSQGSSATITKPLTTDFSPSGTHNAFSPTATALPPPNAQGSQSPATSPGKDSNTASKADSSVLLPLVVVQTSNALDTQSATTSMNKEKQTASSATVPFSQISTTRPPLQKGTQILSAKSQNHHILSHQTLIPDQPLTLSSDTATTRILLKTSNSHTVLVIGSSTSTLVITPSTAAASSSAFSSPVTSISLPPLVIGTQTISANSQNEYAIGDQTLKPGGAITASGTTISLASSPTQLVVGTTTEGFGWYIMSGLGAGPSTSASASHTGTPLTGAAVGRHKISSESAILAVGTVIVLVVVL